MSVRPGETFAGYRVERELGAGGMGSVFLARHPRLPRYDAIKLLRPELSSDPTFVKRFEREAEMAARLDHPNIVPVHDCGSQDGQLWISMRFIDGTNAEKALQEMPGGMPPARAVRIVEKIASALDYAHRHLLLHRDVKPANILLCAGEEDEDEERVFLSDFGVAKPIGDTAASTLTGDAVLGTLDYSSPEQIKGYPPDNRWDIYALGCVLYKLLTGSVPYTGESVAARIYAHLNNPPPRPSARTPTLPAGFDEVVATAMAKNPGDRYSTCRALALAARAALATDAGETDGPTTPFAMGSDEPGRTGSTGGAESVPGVSGAWSLSALGGPWRFAGGRTGATGRQPAPGAGTTRPEREAGPQGIDDSAQRTVRISRRGPTDAR